jgi:hypothetical protein
MTRTSLAVAVLGLMLLPGCGRGENTPGQPSADERAKIDNIARKLDEQSTFDTSPDSLVPAEEGATIANQATPAPPDPPTPANASGNAAR